MWGFEATSIHPDLASDWEDVTTRVIMYNCVSGIIRSALEAMGLIIE